MVKKKKKESTRQKIMALLEELNVRAVVKKNQVFGGDDS